MSDEEPAPQPIDDLAAIDAVAAQLFWLSESPSSTIRDEIQGTLDLQVSGAVLVCLNCIDAPQVFTAAGDGGITKTGLAFDFTLLVVDPTGTAHALAGVITYAGAQRGTLARTRMFFDIGATRTDAAHEATFMARIDELHAETLAER